MKKFISVFITVVCLQLISGCTFVSNTLKYKSASEEFAATLMKGDYDKCLSMMDFSSEALRHVNVDSLKQIFTEAHEIIENQCGPNPDYTMMGSEKRWSPFARQSATDIYTLFYMQFKSDKRFGVIKYAFNDENGKIVGFVLLNIDQPNPVFRTFWLFIALGVLVVVFNLYALNTLRLSGVSNKWIFYLLMTFLNVPVIGYNAVTGIYFKLAAFQLLGMGFSFMGYLGTTAYAGFPIVAIVILIGFRMGRWK